VLSGTPLDHQDERVAYQHLYRDAAARLVASGKTADHASGARYAASTPAHAPDQAPDQAPDPAPNHAADHAPIHAPRPGTRPASGSASGALSDDDAAPGPWHRLRRWLGGDGWVRPAFAALALVVVVQNIVPLSSRTGGDADEDAVRFRNVPQLQGDPSADLALQWKPGVRVDEAQRLLQAQRADVVAGPDARGMWFVRVPDLAAARAALSASPLVESVGPP
jgi:hypothetical protein